MRMTNQTLLSLCSQMDVPTDTDSDADEQIDVLNTLSEQEPSTIKLVRNVLSQVQAEFASWNVAYCHHVLTSFTAPSSWRSRLHPDFRLPSLASITAPPSLSSATYEAPYSAQLVSQEIYSPDGTVVDISSVKLEIIHLSSTLESHPPYESCSPLHRSVFKGDDSDNMAFMPYADDHTFDQVDHARHYDSFSWQDTFDPDCEHDTRSVIVRHDNISQLYSGSGRTRGGV